MKTFETRPNDKWVYGEKDPQDNYIFLGPCPECGCRTFNYGGGWRCTQPLCCFSANNSMPNFGPEPSWWHENINLKIDGTSWCAYYDDFIDIQTSVCGFGDTPREAVKNLKTTIQK